MTDAIAAAENDLKMAQVQLEIVKILAPLQHEQRERVMRVLQHMVAIDELLPGSFDRMAAGLFERD